MAMYEQAVPQFTQFYPVETPFTTVLTESTFEGHTPLFEEPHGQLTVWQNPNANQRMVLLLPAVLLIIVMMTGGLWWLMRSNVAAAVLDTDQPVVLPANVVEAAVVPSGGEIAALFTDEIQHWAPHIGRWAAENNLDPNMVATIMQVESCGDPRAISRSNAQGLFQVMPFHFTADEQMLDPDTNARRGMAYLSERLVQSGGEVGHAFAGYNGGHVATAGNWDSWVHETQRYYVWTTGIYADAQKGLATSDTLDKWLTAGGASLCNQASNRLGLR